MVLVTKFIDTDNRVMICGGEGKGNMVGESKRGINGNGKFFLIKKKHLVMISTIFIESSSI